MSMYRPDWTITSDEVVQGSMLWLGSVEEVERSQLQRGSALQPVRNINNGSVANGGMLNHPMLVISRPAWNPSIIYFLPMTSHAGRPLKQKYRGRKARFHSATFAPISPAPDHILFELGDVRYKKLTLADGGELEKPTYANVREVYRMDWRDAQVYWGGDSTVRKRWQLDAESIERVYGLACSAPKSALKREVQFVVGRERRDSGMRMTGRATGPVRAGPSMPSLQYQPPPLPIVPGPGANMTRPVAPRTWETYDNAFAQQLPPPSGPSRQDNVAAYRPPPRQEQRAPLPQPPSLPQRPPHVTTEEYQHYINNLYNGYLRRQSSPSGSNYSS